LKRLPAGKKTEELYKKGKRLLTPEIVLIFWKKKNGQESHIAIHAGKRIGKAADRNRIKRRIREALRRVGPDETPFEGIVIPRPSIKGKNFLEITGIVRRLLTRLKGDIGSG
jgi:ribonuclease P protein component